MFAIKTASDYLAKVEADYAALLGRIDDSGLGMNSTLSLYHLHEWVWATHLKSMNPPAIGGDVFRKKADFVAWLDRNCPHFELVQDLANGAKHCLPVIASTSQVAGFGRGPYGIGPFGKTYLLIDLGEEKSGVERWAVAHLMLGEVVTFWRALFRQMGLRDAT